MKVQNNGGPLMMAMGDREQKVKQATAKYEQNLEKATERVDLTTQQISAMEQLKRLVQSFTTNAGIMSSQVNNPFISNGVDITTQEANGIATNYVNVTLGDKAQQGTFNVGVNQVATASRLIIDNNGNPLTAIPGIAGTLTIDVGLTPNVVTVALGDSLTQIIDNINTQFSNNNVEAQAFAVTTPLGSYIEIRHEQTGANAITMNWVDGINNTELTQHSYTLGQKAKITVEGIEIEQNSNTFNDVLPGVTIKAISPNTSPGAILNTQTVSIINDPATALTPLANFLNSYNSLKVFVAQMTERQGNGFADTAVLNNSSTISQVQNLLDGFGLGVNTSGGLYKTLSDIGIGFGMDPIPTAESNKLGVEILQVLDKNKLTDAVTNHFTDFTNLFRAAPTFVSNNANHGTVLGFGSTSSLLPNNVLNVDIPVSITLNNDGNGNATVGSIAATIGGQVYNGNYENGIITFPDTPLSGISFTYSNLDYYNNSFGSENFTVKLTQGLTDVAFYNSNALVSSDGSSGSIIFNQKTLADSLKQQTEDQQKIEDTIATKRKEIEAAFDKVSVLDTYNNFIKDALLELLGTGNN